MTLTEYADRIAGGDQGAWHAAARRAAALAAGSTMRWTEAQGTYPEQEIPLTTLALLVYAVAQQRGVDPGEVSLEQVAEWPAIRAQKEAALAAVLRDSGHDLATGGSRWSTPRPSDDPVADAWWGLVTYSPIDVDSADWWPGPNLAYGFAGVDSLLRGGPGLA